ncbi:Cytochrome P450 monooxygenase FUM15 [Metarhizium anisopliae]|nr:Cytochrome P450 monooxygenase FUM15 [Metarhizium anisopliae]
MAVPLPLFTAVAAAGTLLFITQQQEWTRKLAIGAFAVVFGIQMVIYSIYSLFIYPFFLSPYRHLPKPPGGDYLFGHTRQVVKEGLGTTARKWIASIPNDGFIHIRWAFNREMLLVTSPQALSEILVAKSYEFAKPQFLRDTLGPVIGHALVLAEGDAHKLQRRNLMPAFAFRHIKDLYPLFWQKSREVVRVMTAECDGLGVLNMEAGAWASRCTLDVIGTAGLGRDFDAIHDDHNELVETYMTLSHPSKTDRILMILADFAGLFVPVKPFLNVPFPRLRQVQRSSNMIRDVCRDVIQAKKQKLEKGQLNDVDIVSIALRSGVFSEDELVDQMMTFLGAGHETTGSALTWAIYALCRFPDIQSRLRDEVRANLPSVDEETDITSADIDRLPYLNAVCNEVLRMYSPVPQTFRDAVCDTSVLDRRIHKGTRLILAAWGTNVDTALWGADAGEFNPERWLSVNDGGEHSVKRASLGGASSNYALLTFLHGPRSCIGQAFAKSEFACLLAAWVGRFRFELKDSRLMDEENMVFEQLVTVKAVEGLYVKATVVPGY